MDENVSDDVKRRLRSDQLISDMQAFKAANRLAAFEDFIRWYSPKDWNEAEKRLSTRMADESNLWKALWNTAEPIVACDQKQLFDPFLEGERCLHFLEDISLRELCGFINEHLADNFLEQLRSISTQMKISGLETTDLDQMASLLSFHYFFSIEVSYVFITLIKSLLVSQNIF